ncbi:2-amino-4-hydroxy-6-hydroxymethyldihydropteridine diphosphokinase [Amycolatopsis cihanbeyliensis]|uniref:2-amino-4-hydroxy-6-hydroxymethyldihydropteridine diphosphokinase n=1 Tax=Amycolatopsis cihanbeyliensis TaxID=1128664 RepID=A0A542DC23_AMYCI|nr:2-amino-4-hydroxy-6-hydroxymethyldihydropteridine diphosphokinase [Amycolatopsis cihanbeyliensis]TQJ00624.1 2-amino-4-hydroxy-6-hydroxymethyldihydropteridine diphosphokinase [Amycolatopsis cihanbeyliensis]
MSRAVLSIGSNLGDRLHHLRLATTAFREELRAVSPVYETAPWGGVEQDEFLNAVLVVESAESTDRTARDWLAAGQELERRAARERTRRWGPRTLDVDIVHVPGVRSADPGLILPHPRAHQRAFVLLPWLDVEPDAVLPGHGRVADLVAALPATETEGVRRRGDLRL